MVASILLYYIDLIAPIILSIQGLIYLKVRKNVNKIINIMHNELSVINNLWTSTKFYNE
jgi:hypothetical protein